LISSGKQSLGGGPYKASLRIRNRAYKFDGTALIPTPARKATQPSILMWSPSVSVIPILLRPPFGHSTLRRFAAELAASAPEELKLPVVPRRAGVLLAAASIGDNVRGSHMEALAGIALRKIAMVQKDARVAIISMF
jgi:hypothetical protein